MRVLIEIFLIFERGLAGSPYAIKDYYDIDPDLAVDIPNRTKSVCVLVCILTRVPWSNKTARIRP